MGVLPGLRGRTPLKLNSYFWGLPNLKVAVDEVGVVGPVVAVASVLAAPNVNVDGGAAAALVCREPNTNPVALPVAEEACAGAAGLPRPAWRPENPKENLAGAAVEGALPMGKPPPPETGAANFSSALSGGREACKVQGREKSCGDVPESHEAIRCAM